MARQRVMSEREYLDSKGVGSPISGALDDKLRSNRQLRTQRGTDRFNKQARSAIDSYHDRRAQAQREYSRLVSSGKVRPPSIREQIISRAQGNPDNASVRAARRVAAKHGWSWKSSGNGSKGRSGRSGG